MHISNEVGLTIGRDAIMSISDTATRAANVLIRDMSIEAVREGIRRMKREEVARALVGLRKATHCNDLDAIFDSAVRLEADTTRIPKNAGPLASLRYSR